MIQPFFSLKSFLLGLLLLLTTISYINCTTQKIILTKPIDGYVTFSQIEFSATNDDEVHILLTYICHTNNDLILNNIADRISKELSDIASKNDMATPVTTFNDSTGQSLIIAKNYSQVAIFFDNVNQRFKTISKDSKVNIPETILKANFIHDSVNNKAEFCFSPFLFEPYALISFKADNGNLTFKFKTDSSTLLKRTSTDKFAEFLILNKPSDTLFRTRIEAIHITYNKSPLPWYSWERIKNVFSSNDKTSNNKIKEKNINPNKKDNAKWYEVWSSTNETLKWIAGVALPILAFFGITRIKKKKST